MHQKYNEPILYNPSRDIHFSVKWVELWSWLNQMIFLDGTMWVNKHCVTIQQTLTEEIKLGV
jgi:hypothetical protein